MCNHWFTLRVLENGVISQYWMDCTKCIAVLYKDWISREWREWDNTQEDKLGSE